LLRNVKNRGVATGRRAAIRGTRGWLPRWHTGWRALDWEVVARWRWAALRVGTGGGRRGPAVGGGPVGRAPPPLCHGALFGQQPPPHYEVVVEWKGAGLVRLGDVQQSV